VQDFEGKTAVITGGASGMGLSMAETFAREGMNIVLADVEESALKVASERIEALGAPVLAVQTDVASETAMDHLGEAIRDRFGDVDILCLNAGVAGGGGRTDLLSTKDWKWAIDVNLYGIIHGLRVFLGDMRRRDSGNIVITASVAGLTSFPGSLPYNATKHAAVSIAEGLFSELADTGSNLRIHCLCPGIVATQIHRSERNRPKTSLNSCLRPSSRDVSGYSPTVSIAMRSASGIVRSRMTPTRRRVGRSSRSTRNSGECGCGSRSGGAGQGRATNVSRAILARFARENHG
jgi:NAD(P)-dependent dehydrogenase (short-subunit alcohol dehydrogenase family)